jgi:hypothetical protein
MTEDIGQETIAVQKRSLCVAVYRCFLRQSDSMQVRSHNPNPLVHISCRRHQGVDQLKKLDVFKNETVGGEPFHCAITIKRNDPEKLSISFLGNGRKP